MGVSSTDLGPWTDLVVGGGWRAVGGPPPSLTISFALISFSGSSASAWFLPLFLLLFFDLLFFSLPFDDLDENMAANAVYGHA